MAGDAVENAWKDWLKRKFPNHFTRSKVLDVGSADINGTNKSWFENCEYIGIDILPYKNVDKVCVAHRYKAKKESFDVICSTSQLEHDMYWKKTLRKMVELLKPGGLMFFAAGYQRTKHGTKDQAPLDSLTSQLKSSWADFYLRLTIEKVHSVLDLDEIFSEYEIEYTKSKTDIHFWGIKRGIKK